MSRSNQWSPDRNLGPYRRPAGASGHNTGMVWGGLQQLIEQGPGRKRRRAISAHCRGQGRQTAGAMKRLQRDVHETQTTKCDNPAQTGTSYRPHQTPAGHSWQAIHPSNRSQRRIFPPWKRGRMESVKPSCLQRRCSEPFWGLDHVPGIGRRTGPERQGAAQDQC
jgi:hypothetical protein